jgi:hypothetical protein
MNGTNERAYCIGVKSSVAVRRKCDAFRKCCGNACQDGRQEKRDVNHDEKVKSAWIVKASDV